MDPSIAFYNTYNACCNTIKGYPNATTTLGDLSNASCNVYEACWNAITVLVPQQKQSVGCIYLVSR
jgi:hypothetical protein